MVNLVKHYMESAGAFAVLSLCSAHFCRILAKALSFAGIHLSSVYRGKTCLLDIQT